MPTPYPALVIDTDSALGQRVRGLLDQAGIRGIRSGAAQQGERVLLVDAGPLQLKQAQRAGAQHIVHVQQAASAGRVGLYELSSQPRLSWLSTQLYFEGLLPRIALALSTGRFVSAAPARRAAYISHEDAAITAAALLASDVQVGSSLALTGPSALSHADVSALVAELFSRSIDVEQLTMDGLAPELVRRGLSPEEARLSAQLDQALLRELPDVSHDGARITGMAPLSVGAMLQRLREPLLGAASQLARGPSLGSASDLWSCSAQA